VIAPASSVFDLLLDPLHHRHRGDKDKCRKHLMRLKARVEKAPRDAHGGEGLHHLEIARR